jgi:hypothetical protein
MTPLQAALLIGLAVLVWRWARRPPTDPEDREEIAQETKRW